MNCASSCSGTLMRLGTFVNHKSTSKTGRKNLKEYYVNISLKSIPLLFTLTSDKYKCNNFTQFKVCAFEIGFGKSRVMQFTSSYGFYPRRRKQNVIYHITNDEYTNILLLLLGNS